MNKFSVFDFIEIKINFVTQYSRTYNFPFKTFRLFPNGQPVNT
jgi:hypothetical protein